MLVKTQNPEDWSFLCWATTPGQLSGAERTGSGEGEKVEEGQAEPEGDCAMPGSLGLFCIPWRPAKNVMTWWILGRYFEVEVGNVQNKYETKTYFE